MKVEALEWVKGNQELIDLRADPDGFDLAVRSKIVRDNLFNKVSREDKDVISKVRDWGARSEMCRERASSKERKTRAKW